MSALSWCPSALRKQVKANTIQTETYDNEQRKQIRSINSENRCNCCPLDGAKDTVLSHLCHKIIIVKEEEADHSDDEESSASGLHRVTEKPTEMHLRLNIPESDIFIETKVSDYKLVM